MIQDFLPNFLESEATARESLKGYYKNGEKIGEFKWHEKHILCYKPNKKISARHETVENIKMMKEFFERKR